MGGPYELIVIGFEGNRFTGKVAPALQALRDKRIITLLDLLFVSRDGAGELTVRELSDLTVDDVTALGLDAPEATGRDRAVAWFSPDELEAVGKDLPENSSVLVALFEHTWAADFRDAVAGAGGEVFSAERVPAELVEQAVRHPA